MLVLASTLPGAFRKLMSTEVQQLRQLVSPTPQLARTLQLLDGPIAAAPQQALKAGRAAANLQALQQHQQQQQQALTAAAADSIPSGDDADGSGGSSALGPSAEDLVKDYAEAYASMKETMEV
jgi:hypothetical protein